MGRVSFHYSLEWAHPQCCWVATLRLPVFSLEFYTFSCQCFSSWILVQLTIAVSIVLPLSAALPFLFGYLWSIYFTALSHNLAFPQRAEPKLPSYASSKRNLTEIQLNLWEELHHRFLKSLQKNKTMLASPGRRKVVFVVQMAFSMQCQAPIHWCYMEYDTRIPAGLHPQAEISLCCHPSTSQPLTSTGFP